MITLAQRQRPDTGHVKRGNMVNPVNVFGALKNLLPKARNKAEEIAKTILELRAVGRSNEVTEEMMEAADDKYMFDNTPLDMSQEARMARASDAGFDVDRLMYRGSPQNESVIDRDRLFSSDSGYVASTYAKGGSLPSSQTNSVVVPILTKLQDLKIYSCIEALIHHIA